MPVLSPNEVLQRFNQNGRNSSHFVWLLASLQFFESSDGWVFAYLPFKKVTLLALEPLIPGSPCQYTQQEEEAFERAWKEFLNHVRPKITAWVGIYRPFKDLLKAHGFQSLQMGNEPWVRLDDCIPRGNSGKGVRNARNQALNLGFRVIEWTAKEIQADPHKMQALQDVLADWKSHRILEFGGFLNTTAPFTQMEHRRYFIACLPAARQANSLVNPLANPKSHLKVEAFLIATPVPGIQSYFLEDLITRSPCARGVGELLTLEAMLSLAESGAKTASLGVISGASHSKSALTQANLPPSVRLLLQTLPRLLKKIYNFDGIETFRKRFKPQIWEEIHLAVKVEPGSGISPAKAWLETFWALLQAFRPRLQLEQKSLQRFLLHPLRRCPLTVLISLVSFTLFAWVNHLDTLPLSALNRYGFTASAPVHEWLYRGVTSDYLYYNATHFWTWGGAYFLLLFWAEKSHKRNFIIPFVLVTSFLDDLINYLLIIAPFNYFHPVLFMRLIQTKDVGSSLELMTLLGLLLSQIRKHREIIFTLVAAASVFAFLFQATHLQSLVMSINHFLFLCLGFIAGKIKFEWERQKMSSASKRKPPEGRSVLPAWTPKKSHLKIVEQGPPASHRSK